MENRRFNIQPQTTNPYIKLYLVYNFVLKYIQELLLNTDLTLAQLLISTLNICAKSKGWFGHTEQFFIYIIQYNKQITWPD